MGTQKYASTTIRNVPTAANPELDSRALHPCVDSEILTSEAEAALRILMKAVDCNEEFMLSSENRHQLEILGLKAKKKQAILDEKFLIAHSIKNEIDNLSDSKSRY